MLLEDLAARVVFASRLKAARLAAGLTQEALGVCAGIPKDVARTRINRYEKAVHDCDLATAKKLAGELGLPLAALYADTDVMAKAIQAFALLGTAEQSVVMEELVARAETKRRRKKG
jgi:transcriptional regulator with XRE-family HTH domain